MAISQWLLSRAVKLWRKVGGIDVFLSAIRFTELVVSHAIGIALQIVVPVVAADCVKSCMVIVDPSCQFFISPGLSIFAYSFNFEIP